LRLIQDDTLNGISYRIRHRMHRPSVPPVVVRTDL
jgi:hypothetical protein